MSNVDPKIKEVIDAGKRAGVSEDALRDFAASLKQYAVAEAQAHVDLVRAGHEAAMRQQAEIFASELAGYIRRIAELESRPA